LSGIFRGLRGRGRISEENVAEVMREIRTALLTAETLARMANGRPTSAPAVGCQHIESRRRPA